MRAPEIGHNGPKRTSENQENLLENPRPLEKWTPDDPQTSEGLNSSIESFSIGIQPRRALLFNKVLLLGELLELLISSPRNDKKKSTDGKSLRGLFHTGPPQEALDLPWKTSSAMEGLPSRPYR